MNSNHKTLLLKIALLAFIGCEIAMLSIHNLISRFNPSCVMSIPKHPIAFILCWIATIAAIILAINPMIKHGKIIKKEKLEEYLSQASDAEQIEKTRKRRGIRTRVLLCLASAGFAAQCALAVPRYALTSDNGLIEYGPLNQIIRQAPESDFKDVEIGIWRLEGARSRPHYKCGIRFKAFENNFSFYGNSEKALKYYNRLKEKGKARISGNGYESIILRKTMQWTPERRHLLRKLFDC